MIKRTTNLSTNFSFLVNRLINFRQKLCKLDHKLLSKQLIYLADNINWHCDLCYQPSKFGSHLCTDCIEDFPLITAACRQCGLPLNNHSVKQQLICVECLHQAPFFTKTLVPFYYSFPINKLINEGKQQGKQFWFKELSEYLFKKINTHYIHESKPNLIIPVPIHKSKMNQRTYNQAEIIARELSKLTNIPMNKTALIKIKETNATKSLIKKDRIKALKSCFTSLTPEEIRGKHIALVDDIVTTKATANEVSKTLLLNGANRVDVWCLARTPKKPHS